MVADKIYDLLPANLPKTIGDLPSTETDAVAIMEYNGATSTEYFGMRNEENSIFQPIVKIVVRTDSYEEGVAWSELIKQTLHRHTDEYFISVMLVGTPMYLGRDEMKLHEFQVTFKTQVKE